MSKPKKLHLIRDVLDKLLVDRDGIPLGRVDGIVLLISAEQAQPRIIQIECGMKTLLQRLSTRWTQRIQRISRRLGWRWRAPVHVDWSNIYEIGKELTLNVRGEDSKLLASERWLRDHVIRQIPGNGLKKDL
jgi:sporulation protein YlmC with PRC-barrel domain